MLPLFKTLHFCGKNSVTLTFSYWEETESSLKQLLFFLTDKKVTFRWYETWFQEIDFFVGMFTKLYKATVSIIMSVYPPARMKQLCSHWMDFHEIWHLSIFLKICPEKLSFIKITQQ